MKSTGLLTEDVFLEADPDYRESFTKGCGPRDGPLGTFHTELGAELSGR